MQNKETEDSRNFNAIRNGVQNIPASIICFHLVPVNRQFAFQSAELSGNIYSPSVRMFSRSSEGRAIKCVKR